MVALHGIDARSACKPLISGRGESERDHSTALASGVARRGVSGRRRKQSLATPRRISRRHLRGERSARPIGRQQACQLGCGMEGRAAARCRASVLHASRPRQTTHLAPFSHAFARPSVGRQSCIGRLSFGLQRPPPSPSTLSQPSLHLSLSPKQPPLIHQQPPPIPNPPRLFPCFLVALP